MTPLDPLPGSDLSDASTGVPSGDPEYPVACWHDGQPVPDLDRLAPEHWRQALTALTPAARRVAVRTARDPEANREASLLATELELFTDPPPVAPDEPAPIAPGRSRALRLTGRRSAPPARSTSASALPSTRCWRKAAESVGARPAELARLLTMRGVEQMRWEERSRR